MKKRSIYLLIGLAIIFSACEDKDMQATSPTFDVNVDKLEYAPGEEVKFNINGNAQYVSFYSGEMYNDYACRDGRVVEHEGLKMSFYSRVKLGKQENQLSVLISSDFNGDFSDFANVSSAHWTDITSSFTLSQGEVTSSGVADIQSYVQNGKDNYIAFRYLMRPTAQYGKRRTWQISELSLYSNSPQIGQVPVIGGTDSFRIVDEGAGTDHECSSSITSSLIELQGPLEEATRQVEHWAISVPFQKNSTMNLGPDRPYAIKGFSDAELTEYSHVYEKPGKYTVTFVAFNATALDKKEVIKQLNITVKRPSDQTEE